MRLSTIAIALVAPLAVAVTAAPQGLPGLDLFSGNSVGSGNGNDNTLGDVGSSNGQNSGFDGAGTGAGSNNANGAGSDNDGNADGTGSGNEASNALTGIAETLFGKKG